MPRQTSRRNPKGKQSKNVMSVLMHLADRSLQLSDQTVMSQQDSFETRPRSNLPPSSIPKSFAHQGYWYRAAYSPGQITTSGAFPQSFGYSFALSSLNDYAAFATVFDQYCIAQVVFRVYPIVDATTTTIAPGDLITLIDHDDASTVATKAQAQAYGTMLCTKGTIGHTRVIAPRVAVAAYSGSVFTAFANQRSYIDCASASVPHYGAKVFLDASVGATYTYTVEVELFVHFRDTRG